MREIKFRAWHKIYKGMMYFELSELNDSMITKVEDGWYLEHIELMQFTGLTDRSGKGIYDGDILIAEWHWTKPHAFVFPDDFYWIQEVSLEGDNLEVIGNIYETPELASQAISG